MSDVVVLLHMLHMLVVVGPKRNAILDMTHGAAEINGPKRGWDMREVVFRASKVESNLSTVFQLDAVHALDISVRIDIRIRKVFAANLKTVMILMAYHAMRADGEAVYYFLDVLVCIVDQV
jgi:hypothetical protein